MVDAQPVAGDDGRRAPALVLLAPVLGPRLAPAAAPEEAQQRAGQQAVPGGVVMLLLVALVGLLLRFLGEQRSWRLLGWGKRRYQQPCTTKEGLSSL